MKIVVLKFGGTSVGDLNRIKKVSKIIISYIKKKYKVIVVSSAMSGVTNDLIIKSKKITEITSFEIEDKFFEKKVDKFIRKNNLKWN